MNRIYGLLLSALCVAAGVWLIRIRSFVLDLSSNPNPSDNLLIVFLAVGVSFIIVGGLLSIPSFSEE